MGKLFKSAAAAALAILLALGWGLGCGQKEKPLSFTVVFDNAKNLSAGQFVVYKGIRIGEVTAVRLAHGGKVMVDVVIAPEHRQLPYREAEFAIEKPGGMTDLSGEKQLTMKDRKAGTRSPVTDGEMVDGTNGLLDKLTGMAGGYGAAALESLGAAKEKLAVELGSFLQSPEGQELVREMEQFATDAKRTGQEKYSEFLTQQLPELEKRAVELRDKLEKEGYGEKAKEFWKSFDEWRSQAKQYE